MPNTCQIGSWSADAVPVLLTLQTDRHVFRNVLAELALRLKTRFILFAPTADHLDAVARFGYSEVHRRSFRPPTLFDTMDGGRPTADQQLTPEDVPTED